ncbi:hypothetical protein FACS1894206_01170 [Deltaproteobacteria bacterium]|nr:hypothetical protein FACS1894206_01170 [Deltaproteobacteria bacterium]
MGKKICFLLSCFLGLSFCSLSLFPPISHAAQIAADGSSSITQEEWRRLLEDNPNLQEADIKLNRNYNTIRGSLSPDARRALAAKQRAWIAKRDQEAKRFAPASPERIRYLVKATQECAEELRASYPVPAKQAEPASPAPPITKPAPETPAKASPATSKNETAAAHPGAQSRRLAITAAEFTASYNQLADAYKILPFPPAPTSVTRSGTSRIENYTLGKNMTAKFKYTEGQYDRPEIITFLAEPYMTGTPRQRDEIAYALTAILKTLTGDTAPDGAKRDTALLRFIQDINKGFPADASRIWKNAGLVFVVTYMQKNDLFALVVNR